MVVINLMVSKNESEIHI